MNIWQDSNNIKKTINSTTVREVRNNFNNIGTEYIDDPVIKEALNKGQENFIDKYFDTKVKPCVGHSVESDKEEDKVMVDENIYFKKSEWIKFHEWQNRLK